MSMYYAAVGCPACGNRFQTPIEQILDVRVDPQAKARAMSGQVNVAVCPACGTGGALNIPFLYHDPEKETALLYLPMEVGKTEVERQKHAGTLTKQLMNSLAPEDRKGYLLQPETFINAESFLRRLLEIEGVTEDDLQRNRAQQQLLEQLLQSTEETREAILKEHEALIDETFFSLLDYLLRMTASAGEESPQFQQVQGLMNYIIENNPTGQRIKQRSEILRVFLDDPNRETLLQALLAANEENAVAYLVQAGLPVMDYEFFQQLLKHIETAETPEEKTRLTDLRRQILAMREKIREQGKVQSEARFALLQRLLQSTDPLKMARSHLSELDDMFFMVLRSEMQLAHEQAEPAYAQQLSKLMQLLEELQEEGLPPALVLMRRLMTAESEEDEQALLQQNRQLLSPEFFETLRVIEDNAQQEGDDEAVERLHALRQRAQAFAPTDSQAPPTAPTTSPSASGEQTTASGLIIAKH